MTNNVSPLLEAEDPDVVREILRHRPDLEARHAATGQTPLEQAAAGVAEGGGDAANWKEIVDLLREAGAEYGLTSAVYLGDLPRVRELVDRDPDRVGGEREFGIRPLAAAAGSGRAEIVEYLLGRGVDPDWGYGPGTDPDDPFAKSGYPVTVAALRHPAVMRLLIRGGADVTAPVEWLGGKSGVWVIEEPASLMHFAAEHDAVESAGLLLEAGVAVDGGDGQGRTPLHVAAIFGRPAMTGFLLRHGADWSAKDAGGRTPLDATEEREKGWWTAMLHDAFGEGPDMELLKVRELLRRARGPVEAPRPRPAAAAPLLEVTLSVRRQDQTGFWASVFGTETLLSETVTTRGGRPAVFEAASPEGWHEAKTEAAGSRVGLRLTPVDAGGGRVWLFWRAEFCDRPKDGGNYRLRARAGFHSASFGKAFDAMSEKAARTHSYGSRSGWRYDRGTYDRRFAVEGVVRVAANRPEAGDGRMAAWRPRPPVVASRP